MSLLPKKGYFLCPNCGTPERDGRLVIKKHIDYSNLDLIKCTNCKSQFIRKAQIPDGYSILQRFLRMIHLPPFPQWVVWLCPHCGHPDQFGFIVTGNNIASCKWCGKSFNRYKMTPDNISKRFVRWITGKHYWGPEWWPEENQ